MTNKPEVTISAAELIDISRQMRDLGSQIDRLSKRGPRIETPPAPPSILETLTRSASLSNTAVLTLDALRDVRERHSPSSLARRSYCRRSPEQRGYRWRPRAMRCPS